MPERLLRRYYLEMLWRALANGWQALRADWRETETAKILATYLRLPARVEAEEAQSLREALDRIQLECPDPEFPNLRHALQVLLTVTNRGAFRIVG